MKNIMKRFLVLGFTLAFITTMAYTNGVERNGDRKYIKVEVNGLACPFCAYGLEKKLKKLEGAKGLRVFLQEGYAVFNVPSDKVPSEEKLKKIVVDAGFEARSISFSDEPFSDPEEGSN